MVSCHSPPVNGRGSETYARSALVAAGWVFAMSSPPPTPLPPAGGGTCRHLVVSRQNPISSLLRYACNGGGRSLPGRLSYSAFFWSTLWDGIGHSHCPDIDLAAASCRNKSVASWSPDRRFTGASVSLHRRARLSRRRRFPMTLCRENGAKRGDDTVNFVGKSDCRVVATDQARPTSLSGMPASASCAGSRCAPDSTWARPWT